MITATVLSSLLGILTAMLPRLFGYLEAKQKSKDLVTMNNHEIRMFELQINKLERTAEIELRKLDVTYSGEANLAVYEFARPTAGWTARLSEFIRPFITLVFTILFVAKIVTTLAFVFGLTYNPAPGFTGTTMAVLNAFLHGVNSVWDDKTHELFVTIIVFWFGDRAMNKGKK